SHSARFRAEPPGSTDRGSAAARAHALSESIANMHSIGEAMGVHAQHIDVLWITMLWVCGVMYALVLGFLVFALARRGRRRDEREVVGAEDERGLSHALMTWIVLIVGGLFGLTLFSYVTDRA